MFWGHQILTISNIPNRGFNVVAGKLFILYTDEKMGKGVLQVADHAWLSQKVIMKIESFIKIFVGRDFLIYLEYNLTLFKIHLHDHFKKNQFFQSFNNFQKFNFFWVATSFLKFFESF